MGVSTGRGDENLKRLWRSAPFLPETARLLGTRYRPLFLFYARDHVSDGESAAVADAMAFLEFLSGQNRVALLLQERKALGRDRRLLRRRFRLKRNGATVSAVEKWKILQWLRL